MVVVSLEDVKKLRGQTGVGIGDCKDALENSKGDFEKAVEFLRKKGILKAKKRAGREAANGFIGSYVHNGQIAVLVELTCETDFVARNEKFQALAKELALHIAAEAPLYVSRDEVPQKEVEKEKKLMKEKLLEEGKPEALLDKIAEGQLQKFYEETCLLDQPYVRDDKRRIKDLVNEAVASFGEKIEVRRFIRMCLGEEGSIT